MMKMCASFTLSYLTTFRCSVISSVVTSVFKLRRESMDIFLSFRFDTRLQNVNEVKKITLFIETKKKTITPNILL